MRIGDLCEFKINFKDADFWLIRKGDKMSVGKPTKIFNPEHIGVKIINTNMSDPQYLYYVFMCLNQSGEISKLSSGTLRLQHIRITDIKNIEI